MKLNISITNSNNLDNNNIINQRIKSTINWNIDDSLKIGGFRFCLIEYESCKKNNIIYMNSWCALF